MDLRNAGDIRDGHGATPGRSGFHGTVAKKEVEYVQLDFIANPYMTVGRFLTPFGIFK